MIPISRPTFGSEEEQAVLEVMRSGQFTQGKHVRAFDKAFASVTGARAAVATSSAGGGRRRATGELRHCGLLPGRGQGLE